MSAKYQQLADILRSELTPVSQQGGKLPTEAELSHRYHMSRQTVRHALKLLTDEGLIHRRQGSGSYVSSSVSRTASMQVAVVTTFLDDYIFPKILHDVQSCFAQSGYSTLVFATENKVSREREILTQLLTLGVNGILVEGAKTALPTPNADIYIKLKENGIPVLFLHGIYGNLQGFPCILDDNISGGAILTRYLIRKGHKNIAGIFKSDDLQGPQRYQGMIDALRDAQMPIPDDHVFWYDTELRHLMVSRRDVHFLDDILKKRLSPCSAVICYNDEIAHLLIQRLLDHGMRVPEDIAVVSFDDSYYSQIGPVPITSLCHKSDRIGQTAARLLLEMLSGKPARSLSIDWELMERQSG